MYLGICIIVVKLRFQSCIQRRVMYKIIMYSKIYVPAQNYFYNHVFNSVAYTY